MVDWLNTTCITTITIVFLQLITRAINIVLQSTASPADTGRHTRHWQTPLSQLLLIYQIRFLIVILIVVQTNSQSDKDITGGDLAMLD